LTNPHDPYPAPKDQKALEALIAAIARLDTRLGREHAENRTDNADFKREVRDKLDELRKAFPGDDPEGHRRFHDALIAESGARKAFWSDLRGRLLEKGIWAVLVFVAGALWFYFKEHQ
jgi:hypothetical protein